MVFVTEMIEDDAISAPYELTEPATDTGSDSETGSETESRSESSSEVIVKEQPVQSMTTTTPTKGEPKKPANTRTHVTSGARPDNRHQIDSYFLPAPTSASTLTSNNAPRQRRSTKANKGKRKGPCCLVMFEYLRRLYTWFLTFQTTRLCTKGSRWELIFILLALPFDIIMIILLIIFAIIVAIVIIACLSPWILLILCVVIVAGTIILTFNCILCCIPVCCIGYYCRKDTEEKIEDSIV